MTKREVALRLMRMLAGRLLATDNGTPMIMRSYMPALANGAGLPLPAYETAGAAGMDLRAAEDCVLETRRTRV